MPLTDTTNVMYNKENIITSNNQRALKLEQKMLKPMDHKIEEIKKAVSSLNYLDS